MKNIKYITVLSMCAIMIFTSCKKESNLTPENNSNNETTQILIDFKNKLNSKDGSSLSIESATWHLEGLLNYENANNDHNLNNLAHYYDTLSLNYVNTSITFAELNELYSSLIKKLSNHLQITPNSKFDLIDLEIVQLDYQTKVIMISSTGIEISKYIYAQFTSTDYWRWGWNLGKCDGTYVGSDAADKLKDRFNNPINGIPGYYTSVEMKRIFFFNYPDPSLSGTYMMFFANGDGQNPAVEPCISPNELNYYLGKFDYIKDSNCPTGKKFKNANVIEGVGTGMNDWARFHDYELYYGIFTSGSSTN